ncbi:MAG: methyltransferase domain-containing protein [Acidobacteria bacterium]|nr:methyltransferase domain-containing protein [Acidobacteriota bacterium]
MGSREGSSPDRWRRELAHDRRIASRAEAIWDWDTPAGRRRADRRAAFFVEHGALGPGRRALELGCGTGVFLERVARSGADLHGLDLSPDLLARARERVAGTANVRLVQGNAEAMPFPDGSFDAVYGSSVLHHLGLEAALREVHRVLRPGGRTVFTEPNLLNPQIAVTFLVAPRRTLGLSPDEMAFTRFRARALLDRVGFTEPSVRPFDFLHPLVPPSWIDGVARLGSALEAVPGLREIAGSLLIRGTRP